MCGIVGFTGKNEAAPILLDGLSKLEYRGYDSSDWNCQEMCSRGIPKIMDRQESGGVMRELF